MDGKFTATDARCTALDSVREQEIYIDVISAIRTAAKAGKFSLWYDVNIRDLSSINSVLIEDGFTVTTSSVTELVIRW